MGNGCPGNSDPDKVTSKGIDKQIQKEKKKPAIKLLLLGAGESGKSTLAKQLMIIHAQGYEKEEDRIRYKPIVYSNILSNMRSLIEAINTLGFTLKEENEAAVKLVREVDEDTFRSTTSEGMPANLVQGIKDLWNDPAIQQCFQKSSEFQLQDNAKYFFSHLDRVAVSGYVPTVDDVLRVRAKTTGINEIEFSIGDYHFSVTDVGGQRTERRKWIHCFEHITALIFCVGMSEYDQKLEEDGVTNRMAESLKLFSDIMNSKWFKNTPVILFLNKKDLFEEKIKKVPLTKCICFKDYTGPNEYKPAADFIEKKFTSQVQGKLTYVYQTVATNTENIKFIFKAVKDVFITVYLGQLGLLGGDSYLGPSTPAQTRRQDSLSANKLKASKKENEEARGSNGNSGNGTAENG